MKTHGKIFTYLLTLALLVSVPKVSTVAKDNSLASQERHGTVVADYSERLYNM